MKQYKDNKSVIYNGDSLQVLDMLIDLGVKVDAIITDPPYNLVGKLGEIHLFRQDEVRGKDTYSKDTMHYDVGFNQLIWIEKIQKVLKPGGNIIIFNDWENMGDIAKKLRSEKINVKCIGHWQKTNPQPAEWKRRFVSGREYFIHAIKKGKYTFNVDKLNKGVFELGLTPGKEKKEGKHPNQKPLKLMEDIIEILTNKGETVLDCYSGSGSTLLACKNLDRDFIGIELDKEYFDLSVRRIQNHETK